MLLYYLSLATTDEERDIIERIYLDYYPVMQYEVMKYLKNPYDVEDISSYALSTDIPLEPTYLPFSVFCGSIMYWHRLYSASNVSTGLLIILRIAIIYHTPL